MSLKNCPECGKLYLENPSKLCPECYAREEVYEHQIGEYLREHGKASAEEIHQATGVKESIILRMLKSGRLLVDGVSLVSYPCDMCGTPIFENRLCSRCGSSFTQQVKETWQNKNDQESQRTGVRMYTKDKLQK